MAIEQVRAVVREAAAHEERTGALAAHLRETLPALGVRADDPTIQQAVALARQYVESVPALLEATAQAAVALGEWESVEPLLEAVVEYFLEPRDYIPDERGLYGLLDDAYLALRLLEVLANLYRHQTGAELLPVDLSRANQMVRPFIGEGLAATLDQEVVSAVQQQAYEVAMQQLAARQFAAPAGAGGGRSWGGTFEDQTAQFFAENGVSYNVETHYVDQDGVQLY